MKGVKILNDMYKMIFKRKSFHQFPQTEENITEKELAKINEKITQLTPLVKDITVKVKIVPATEITNPRHAEYCLLFYSEKKDNYLTNIGYLGEQLDLYLPSLNIGTLWLGMSKPQELTYEGLDYVIMIAIKKVSEDMFRKNMFKSERKEITEIWQNYNYLEIANIVRFAPSACNSQPWFVESSEKELKVYRYKKPGKSGIMPEEKITYFNKIDIGIFLLVLEVCLKKHNFSYQRKTYVDNNTVEEMTLIAKYQLKSKIM